MFHLFMLRAIHTITIHAGKRNHLLKTHSRLKISEQKLQYLLQHLSIMCDDHVDTVSYVNLAQ